MKTLLLSGQPLEGWLYPRDEEVVIVERQSLILELASTKADPSDKEEWAEALFYYELLSDLELADAYQDLHGY